MGTPRRLAKERVDVVDVCPRCASPFDRQVHRLVLCPECSQECSTACCMPLGEDGVCPECDDN